MTNEEMIKEMSNLLDQVIKFQEHLLILEQRLSVAEKSVKALLSSWHTHPGPSS